MTKAFLASVATAALIAGSGVAFAQDRGGQRPQEVAPSPAPQPQRSAPAEKVAPPMNRGTTGAGADDRMGTRPGAANERGPDRPRQAQDNPNRQDNMNRDNMNRGRDSRAEDSRPAGNMANDRKPNDPRMSTDNNNRNDRDRNAGRNNDRDNGNRATTGQGAAASAGAANLTTDQRTRITTVIKQQNIRPVTNVNFSISIGAKVPRTVQFHPLPATVIEVYPAWRGYEFVLVEEEIVVIDPRTLTIVAVIEA